MSTEYETFSVHLFVVGAVYCTTASSSELWSLSLWDTTGIISACKSWKQPPSPVARKICCNFTFLETTFTNNTQPAFICGPHEAQKWVANMVSMWVCPQVPHGSCLCLSIWTLTALQVWDNWISGSAGTRDPWWTWAPTAEPVHDTSK